MPTPRDVSDKGASTKRSARRGKKNTIIHIHIVYLHIYVHFTLLLFSFWTSHGHRCCHFNAPLVLAFNFITHRIHQSHCSSIFHRVLLTHALALSLFPQVNLCTTRCSYGFSREFSSRVLELTKLTYTRLEDNLIRYRGDRSWIKK